MATKKRRYDEGGKATASSPPPVEKKKKPNLLLGGLGGLIPMALQKTGGMGLIPAAFEKNPDVAMLSPAAALLMKRKKRRPGEPIPPPGGATAAPGSPPPTAAGGMRRGGKATPKKYAKGGNAKDYDVTSLAASTVAGARADRARNHKGEDNPDVLDPAEYIALSEKLRREGSSLGYRPKTIKKAADAIKRQGVNAGDEVYQRLKKAYATRGYAKGGRVSSRGDGIARKGKTKGRYI